MPMPPASSSAASSSITEEGASPPPRPMQALRAGAVPVAPGEQMLRAMVTVSYELTP